MDSSVSAKDKASFCMCAIMFKMQSTAKQATDDNMENVHCVLDN